MEPSKEQFYPRRIAELEQQNADLCAQVSKLTEQAARLSKHSSISSKLPRGKGSGTPFFGIACGWSLTQRSEAGQQSS